MLYQVGLRLNVLRGIMNRLRVVASLLGTALVLVALIGGPMMAQQSAPTFEVASVKPTESRIASTNPLPRAYPGGQFRAGLTTVDGLLAFAYGIRQDLIVGVPDWARQDRFEVSARASSDAPADQIRLMVRSLLEDRFKLVAHIERREMQVLALVRARPDGSLGPSLIGIEDCSAAVVNDLRQKFPQKYPTPMGPGVVAGCASMGLGTLAILLSTDRHRPVIDATGFTGSYYYTLRSNFTPGAAFFGRSNTDVNLPALSTALEEQLGLKLQSRREPVEVVVIDWYRRRLPIETA
jgi:uncharacterized protein (TIGR03435 family)